MLEQQLASARGIMESMGFNDSQIAIFEEAKLKGNLSSSEVLRIMPSSVFKSFSEMRACLDRIHQICDILGINGNGNGSGSSEAEKETDPNSLDFLNEFFYSVSSQKERINEERKVRKSKRADKAEIVARASTDSIESVFDSLRKKEETKKIGKDFELQYYLKEIGEISSLSREEEAELSVRARQGDLTARNALAESNLRFVVAIAKRYLYRGLDFSDLIQGGNLGLLKAIEKFESERGYTIRTYASWWIKQCIIRAFTNSGGFVIRTPEHIFRYASQIKSVIESYRRKFGYDPSDEELCSVLDWKPEKVAWIREVINRKAVFIHEKSEGIRGEGRTNVEQIRNPLQPTPEELVLLKDELLSLHSLLFHILDACGKKRLGARNKNMFRMRFGLDGTGDIKTLEEVGNYFGISRERVRQIMDKILEKAHKKLLLKNKVPSGHMGIWLQGIIERINILESITKQEVLRSMQLEPE